MELAKRIKDLALEEGFDLAGIAPATPPDGFPLYLSWLERDFHGEMGYMKLQAPARQHPASILTEVRSVLMVAINYKPASPFEGKTNTGRVARYAQGVDYHDILREKLNRLLEKIQLLQPGISGRGVVDTAPLLERDFARRAGLGWFGKNTMLINPKLGSYFLIGALLLNVELEADKPFETNHCGTCTACLRACPTEAFPQPGVLDARKCVSYLTIELKKSIPEPLAEGIGNWVFGCDICQEVCPWNRKAPAGKNWESYRNKELEVLDLTELLGMDEKKFRERFRHTPLWRPRRRGILRNACIVLGNTAGLEALHPLEKALQDIEPLVREAAQWAIERIKGRSTTLNLSINPAQG